MRKLRYARILTTLVFASLVAGVCHAQGHRMALAAGDKAPSVNGYTYEGGYYLGDYQDHELTVVNFWATWCTPCREEMPSLHEIYKRHKDDGLEVVGVHVGLLEKKDFTEFRDQVPVEYPLLTSNDRWLSPWGGLNILPRTYLVNNEGRVLRHYIGATAAQVEAMIYDIEAALEGRPLGPVVIPEKPDVATPEDAAEDEAADRP